MSSKEIPGPDFMENFNNFKKILLKFPAGMSSSINRSLDVVAYPGWERTLFALEKKILLVQNATGYYPGPVAPPSADVVD